jgi:hypothetical protein
MTIKKIFITIAVFASCILGSIGQPTVLFSEDFESGISSSYVISNAHFTAGDWEPTASYYNTGGFCIQAKPFSTTSGISYFQLPPVTVSGYTNIYLSFHQIAKIQFFDIGTIEYSSDGSTWFQLVDDGPSGNSDNCDYFGQGLFEAQGSSFREPCYPTWLPGTNIIFNTWWKHERFDLTQICSGLTDLYIRFVLKDGNNNGLESYPGWFIDDIEISDFSCGIDLPTVTADPSNPSATLNYAGPYTIQYIIDDDDGINSVLIYYSVDGGTTYTTASASSINSTNYQFTLPAIPSGANVLYYLVVIDDSNCSDQVITNPIGIIYQSPPTPFCDNASEPLSTNTNCSTPVSICDDLEVKHNFGPNATLPNSMPSLYFSVVTHGSLDLDIAVIPNGTYDLHLIKLYGPFDCFDDLLTVCNNLGSFETPTQTSATLYEYINLSTTQGGLYIIEIQPNQSVGCFSFATADIICHCPEVPCVSCIQSFSPDPEKEYIISGWVKEEDPDIDVTTYVAPQMSIDFFPTGTTSWMSAKGPIIEGWQRIEEKFVIPAGCEAIRLNLRSNNGDVYFDDIRIHPFDGNMKSYVYDPITKQFTAELDENNYATFYEYDEEGNLTRIKKETERGKLTIKEVRSSSVKK